MAIYVNKNRLTVKISSGIGTVVNNSSIWHQDTPKKVLGDHIAHEARTLHVNSFVKI